MTENILVSQDSFYVTFGLPYHSQGSVSTLTKQIVILHVSHLSICFEIYRHNQVRILWQTKQTYYEKKVVERETNIMRRLTTVLISEWRLCFYGACSRKKCGVLQKLLMGMYNTNGFRTEVMKDCYITMESMFLVVKLSLHPSISYANLTILLP